jgi:type II secretory pathway component GspD/PulD (secretin)
MTSLVKRLAPLALLPAVVFISGAAPVPERPPAADPAPGAARAALEQPVTAEFAETPLPAALTQLGEQAKVAIVLDRASVQQLGMDPNEMPVSARLKNVKLKTGLRTVLSQFNLAFAAVGDTVVVTTEDVAQQRLLRQPVDVDAANQPFADALKRLARSTGTNLVIDPRQAKAAQAAVTLRLDDVPLESAVRLLAELAGLKPVRVGNVLFVTSEERADKLRGDGDLVPAAPPGPVPPVERPTPAVVPPAVPAPPVAPPPPAPRGGS